MSNPPPGNVWQTAGRRPQSQSASRTPQNRSGTASPNLQAAPSQPHRSDGVPTTQVTNVWAARSNLAAGSNGQSKLDTTLHNETGSVNGFNAEDVKAFLNKDVGSVAVYKPAEAAGGAKSSGAWGSKSGVTANGQPFLAQLAKQIATLEGGG